jgi:hypothetical protein
MVSAENNNGSDGFDPDTLVKRIAASEPIPLGSLNPIVRFLSNTVRAIRYNKKRHIPCDEFIRGLECKWGRPVDPSSVFWFRHHATAVDLLHQILTGQLVSGTAEIDQNVTLVFIDGAFWYTPGLSREVLDSKDAFGDILDAFSKYFPDAGTVIMYAERAYWKIHGS